MEEILHTKDRGEIILKTYWRQMGNLNLTGLEKCTFCYCLETTDVLWPEIIIP